MQRLLHLASLMVQEIPGAMATLTMLLALVVFGFVFA